jgi:DNA-binding XRE family transcriptional regulator
MKSKAENITKQLNIHIGNLIRNYRKKNGYTIASLASSVHISSTTITDLENGRSLPHIPIIITLSLFLNIPLSEIFQAHITTGSAYTLKDTLITYGLSNKGVESATDYVQYLLIKEKEYV